LSGNSSRFVRGINSKIILKGTPESYCIINCVENNATIKICTDLRAVLESYSCSYQLRSVTSNFTHYGDFLYVLVLSK